MGVGWIIYSALWTRFTIEVSLFTLEAVRDSSAFLYMSGLLAAFLVVGCGLLLSALADQTAIRLSSATDKKSAASAP